MSSNKQKRLQLKERKARRLERRKRAGRGPVPADHKLMCARYSGINTYCTAPTEYLDQPFTCADCGKACVWKAEDQKWWFEVAMGSIYKRAARCLDCRRKRREAREAQKIAMAKSEASKAGGG